MGINNSGTIAGYYDINGTTYHAFVYSADSFSAFPALPGARLSAINDSGQIAGSYSEGGRFHGFIYTGGALTQVDMPGFENTILHGMNNSGDVVGYAYTIDQPIPEPGTGLAALFGVMALAFRKSRAQRSRSRY
jgi:hypothetical protein